MKRFETCPICHTTSFWGCPCGDPYDDYRHTPAGQKTVVDLVSTGMEINSNYHDSAGIVVDVRGPFPYGVHSSYSVTYVHADKWPTRRQGHHCWINELVAVDGRILKLFKANDDEIFIVNSVPRQTEDKRGQFGLFSHQSEMCYN